MKLLRQLLHEQETLANARAKNPIKPKLENIDAEIKALYAEEKELAAKLKTDSDDKASIKYRLGRISYKIDKLQTAADKPKTNRANNLICRSTGKSRNTGKAISKAKK